MLVTAATAPKISTRFSTKVYALKKQFLFSHETHWLSHKSTAILSFPHLPPSSFLAYSLQKDTKKDSFHKEEIQKTQKKHINFAFVDTIHSSLSQNILRSSFDVHHTTT